MDAFTLGNYLSLQRGITYKSSLLDLPGPVLLGLSTIQRDGGFRHDSLRTYGGSSPDKLILKTGDLYVSLKDVTQSGDLLGSVARIPNTIKEGRLTQDTVKLLFKDQETPRSYIYWILRTPQYRDYCRKRATGTTNLGLSREDFLAYPVPKPSQNHISLVNLLDTIDEKIELNRQINETLEAMARAIFQSWFLDFNPVRAKADGRDTGLPSEVAALFPSEMVEVDGWEVPKGWEVAFLPDVFEINPKRSLAKDQIAPYLDMQNVPTQGHRPIDWIQRAFGSGTKFINGDTLLARITPCLENGKTIFVDFLNDGEVGWGSTEYIVLRPKPPLPPEFGYLFARDEDFRSHAILNMSGSSGRQRVPSECFDSYQIVVSSKEIAIRFGKLVKPLMARIKANDEQSRTLAQIRDALLPKLMSGEIDAIKFV